MGSGELLGWSGEMRPRVCGGLGTTDTGLSARVEGSCRGSGRRDIALRPNCVLGELGSGGAFLVTSLCPV